MSLANSQSATGKTTQTFISALIANWSLLGVQVGIFVLLKNHLTRIYTPRTFLPPPDKRAAELPTGPWRWILAVLCAPTQDIIHKNGLDAYMLLRFIWLMIVIFASFTLVTWVIILPVNSAGIDNAVTDGLSKLSWGNIPEDKFHRYAAHVVIVYLLTFFVLYLLRREYIHYTAMRQAFLTSPSYSRLPQSRTVLITSIPKSICTEKQLRLWATFVPGGIQNIWVYKDSKELNSKFKELIEDCEALEIAIATLLRTAVKAKPQLDRSQAKASKSQAYSYSMTDMSLSSSPFRPQHASTQRQYPPPGIHTPTSISFPTELESDLPETVINVAIHAERELLDRLVPPHKRPKHRVFRWGIFRWGGKVDSIDWYKKRISELNTEIARLRSISFSDAKPLGSAFIQCNLQLGAHVLAQCVSHHEPMKMAYKWIQVAPKDVIWENIDDGVYETRFRYVTSWLLSIGFIIVWFFPVSFVGLLSNVSKLCEKFHRLAWICAAPTPIPGIIQGVLPPLLLVATFAILPTILRMLAWYENVPLYSLLSISVYKRYFLFLVIHGFLVVTLSSGLAATVSDIISQPTKTVSQLASHLPDASVFFLTWTVTQGLTGAGSALLQVFTLLMYYLKRCFLGRTPRQAYEVTFMMPSVDFGIILPQLSLLATIGLAYSVLSPVINALTMMAFGFFYIAYKFLLMWVYDQPDEQETGGLYFPVALNFLFVGLYIEQFCLMALFFLKSSSSEHSFLAQGILMLVLLIITISAQVFLKRAFDPLQLYLPMSLATQHVQKKIQNRWVKSGSEDKLLDFDLFNREHIHNVIRKRIKSVKHAAKHEFSTFKQPLKTLLDPLEKPRRSRHTGEGSRKIGESHINNILKETEENVGLGVSRSKPHQSHASALSRNPSTVPKHPVFDPPAPAPSKMREQDVYDITGDDSDFDDNGFEHPSRYKDQPWIWIPRDPFGLSKLFLAELKEARIDVSDDGAVMQEDGVVEVTRSPPDEAWEGGQDA